MARTIFESRVAIDGIDIAFAGVHGADMEDSHFMRIAGHLHRNGYRKASKVADEIAAGIEAAIEEKALTEYHRGYRDALRDMAEAIKRKYTEVHGDGT